MSLSTRLAEQSFNFRRPGLGARFRARRMGPLLDLVDAAHAERGRVDLLDIGGTRGYWNMLPEGYLDDRDLRITLLNRPGGHVSASEGRFTFETGDACDLVGVGDRSYDVVHSNSVVEHVGEWSDMLAYAGEVSRVADRYFVQAPNFWFPVEPHTLTPFFHWLPKPVRVKLVTRSEFGHWKRQPDVASAVVRVDSARLLDRAMFEALFPDAEIIPERLGPLTKSWVAVRRVREPTPAGSAPPPRR